MNPSTPADAGPASITLHSSWKGVVLGVAGAVIVFGFGLGITLANSSIISIVVLVFGVFLLWTTLFDYPVASTFDADGVVRRALLRRHRISWERVDQLTRTRPALAARTLTPGGLTAKIGRRRYLLVDQCESVSEFDALGEVLADRYVELTLDEMLPPPPDTDPTWTYRHKRWEP